MSHSLTRSVPTLAPAPSIARRIRQFFATRRALTEVRSLDERMLHDIGLDQAQVEAAVRGKL